MPDRPTAPEDGEFQEVEITSALAEAAQILFEALIASDPNAFVGGDDAPLGDMITIDGMFDLKKGGAHLLAWLERRRHIR